MFATDTDNDNGYVVVDAEEVLCVRPSRARCWDVTSHVGNRVRITPYTPVYPTDNDNDTEEVLCADQPGARWRCYTTPVGHRGRITPYTPVFATYNDNDNV